MAEIVSDVLIAGEESVEMAEVSGVEAPGPLGPFVAGFAADLSRQGYKPDSVGKQIGLVAALSSWLAAEDVAVSGLSSDVAEQFCAARRAAGHTNRATLRSLDPVLGYLRALGVAPPASGPAPAGPVEELLVRFRRYLEHERGLVPAAASGYVDKVRPFVARFDGPDGLELWRVDVAEVRGFVVEVCPRLGRRAAQLTVVALRALLRFLHLEGELERSLAGAVPSVAGWRLSGLPKRLEPGQLDALLDSCNRSTVIDLRQGRPRGAQADHASVAGSEPMSALHDSLAEYLAVRRALGYRLEGTERLLGQFLDYLDANGADRITVEHALAWTTLPGRGQHPTARVGPAAATTRSSSCSPRPDCEPQS